MAYGLVDAAYNPAEWDEPLKETMIRPLAQAMAAGAIAELALNAAALKASGAAVKLTSAEAIAARLNIDVPDGVSLDFPDWLRHRISTELVDVFQQPYWSGINLTTRDDVAYTVERGLLDGRSVQWIAGNIVDQHGSEYTRARAMAVARTEPVDAMNSGHAMAMERLSEETGMEVRKEWLSVLGNTTRDSHAAMDGVQSDKNGMFDLEGVLIPWPAHRSLPARNRVNCLCSILSSFVGEATRDDQKPVGEAKPDDDATQPPGSQDVSKADLEATGAWIAGKQEALDVLQKIGVTPTSFAEEMAAGLPYRIRWLEILGRDGEVDLRFSLWDSDRQAAALVRSLRVEGDGRIVARHDYFEIHSDLQAQNIGKTILANAVKLYDQLGVSAMELVANIDVGGYAWARYGFSPTADGWEELKPQVRERWESLQQRASQVKHELSEELRRVVEAVLQSDDPKDVWLLSDLQGKLPESFGSEAGEKVAFKLLGGTAWEGSLDMSDAEARERLRSYVGK